MNDRKYEIDIEGKSKNINIDRLKPAYVTNTDADIPDINNEPEPVPVRQWTSIIQKPTKIYAKQRVTFKFPA